jgi:oligopeptide/dipeptide ABC transporter ATP-binding protein
MNSLDPVYRLRDQIVEAIRTHDKTSVSAARERAVHLAKLVGIDPQRLMDYPHQLSGGMKQRMVIAMALALNPRLIVADEPTTALDVIIQDRILEQVVQLQREFKFSMVYISHDIAVIAETCQRVAVMYAGQIVEQGPIGQVLKQPAHPYTMGLRNAFPDIRRPKALISIPGHPPTLAPPPGGCRFAPRCPFATPLCREQAPPLVPVGEGQLAACHYVDQAPAMRQAAQQAETWTSLGQTVEGAV